MSLPRQLSSRGLRVITLLDACKIGLEIGRWESRKKHRDEFQLVFSDQPARLNSDKRELSKTREHLWKLGDK